MAFETRPAGRLFVLALLVLTAAFLACCDVGVSLSDEGIWLSAGWLLDSGVQPWVDWFMPHPSALAWIYDGLFDAFGDDIVVGRRFWAVLRGFGAALGVVVTRRLTGRLGLGLLVGLALLLGCGPWHKSHVLFGQAVTLAALVSLARKPSMLVGLGLGLGQGLAMTLDLANSVWLVPPTVFVLALAPRRGRGMLGGAWLLGTALGLGPLLAVYLPRLSSFRLEVGDGQWLAFDPSWVAQASWAGFPDLIGRLASGQRDTLDLLQGALLDAVVLGAVLGVLAAVRRGIATLAPMSTDLTGRDRLDEERRVRERRAVAWASAVPALVAAAVLPKILVRADTAHVLQNALPFLVLAAEALGAWADDGRGSRRALSVLGAVSLLGSLGAVGWHGGYYSGSVLALARPLEPLGVPGASLRESPARAAELRALVDRLEALTREGETLLGLPTLPTLHALVDMPNAGRLVWLAPAARGDFTPVDRAFAWQITSTRPTWIVLERDGLVHGDGRTLAMQAPRTWQAIRQGYQPVDSVGGFDLLRLRALPLPPQ